MKKHVVHFFKAAGYSLQGLRAAFVNEIAIREEVGCAIVLIPLACWLGKTKVERVLLILPIMLVFMIELLNSAIEAAVNRFGPEYNIFTKQAKDFGSAAVFIALINVVLMWVLILL